jgi:hypothetical protein
VRGGCEGASIVRMAGPTQAQSPLHPTAPSDAQNAMKEIVRNMAQCTPVPEKVRVTVGIWAASVPITSFPVFAEQIEGSVSAIATGDALEWLVATRRGQQQRY